MSSSVSLLVGTALTITIATVSLSEINSSIPNPFAEMSISEFNSMVGVSDLVYDCVSDVLAGDTPEEIIAFIETEAITAGTPDETIKAEAIKQCVYQDPFGWHGTPNEWAIELLETDTWE